MQTRTSSPIHFTELQTSLHPRFTYWAQGFDAHGAGKPETACDEIYPDPRHRKIWREGWRASQVVEQLRDKFLDGKTIPPVSHLFCVPKSS